MSVLLARLKREVRRRTGLVTRSEVEGQIQHVWMKFHELSVRIASIENETKAMLIAGEHLPVLLDRARELNTDLRLVRRMADELAASGLARPTENP